MSGARKYIVNTGAVEVEGRRRVVRRLGEYSQVVDVLSATNMSATNENSALEKQFTTLYSQIGAIITPAKQMLFNNVNPNYKDFTDVIELLYFYEVETVQLNSLYFRYTYTPQQAPATAQPTVLLYKPLKVIDVNSQHEYLTFYCNKTGAVSNPRVNG